VESNPALGVRLPRKRSVQPKITFERSQVARILEALEEPYRTIVLVDAVTGMRASELFALRWSDGLRAPDVFHAAYVLSRRIWTAEEREQRTRNSIIVSPGLVAALRHHRQHVRHSSLDLVFPNAVGNPYEPNNLVMRVLHPTLNALGLTKTGWRAFRRSVATALSEMREPVRTAQQILGHASAQTTLAYYVQTVEESQRSAILRLEKIMFPIWRQAK
jgi:integrase